jgi:hypothetical protein
MISYETPTSDDPANAAETADGAETHDASTHATTGPRYNSSDKPMKRVMAW